MTEHLWTRLLDAKARLKPVQSKYRVIFEDPANPDAPAAVLVPDPNWMAAALAGGVLPPVETYLRDAERTDGEPKEHPYAPPIGPMTEEQAMEYLVMKDLPRRVWGEPTNRPRFAIVRRESIPASRAHRNAWRLADFTTRTAA